MDDTPVTLNGSQIEDVQSFKYLGSMINATGESSEEIRNRISSAWNVFLQLKNSLWKRSEISPRTKLRVYEAMVLSVLLYGCETWSLKAAEASNLDVFHHKCLRYILGIRLSDRVSNEEVRRRGGDHPFVSEVVKMRRLMWFGHTMWRCMDVWSCRRLYFQKMPSTTSMEEESRRTKENMACDSQG